MPAQALTKRPRPATKAEIEQAARRLLDALDLQYGGIFSQNVQEARSALRRLLPAHREPADRASWQP